MIGIPEVLPRYDKGKGLTFKLQRTLQLKRNDDSLQLNFTTQSALKFPKQ